MRKFVYMLLATFGLYMFSAFVSGVSSKRDGWL
jgi:hypothetical protein